MDGLAYRLPFWGRDKIVGMATAFPTGDDLSVCLFFVAAMIGFGIAAGQESGRKRYFFAMMGAISFLCALFWPGIKSLAPKVSNAIGLIADYRVTSWVGGVGLGVMVGALLNEKSRKLKLKSLEEQKQALSHLDVDFDASNSTGHYWIDSAVTKSVQSTKTGALEKIETKEKKYRVRITNKTEHVLREVRAYRIVPGRSPEELSFALSGHLNRILHIGASDYIDVVSVNLDSTWEQFYVLMINCPNYPQINKKIHVNTSAFPALSLLD